MKFYLLSMFLLLKARQGGEFVHVTREEWMYTGASYPELIDLTLAQGCTRCGERGYHPIRAREDVVASGADYPVATHCSFCQPSWAGAKTPCPFLPENHDVCDNPECRLAVPFSEDHCPSCDAYQIQF